MTPDQSSNPQLERLRLYAESHLAPEPRQTAAARRAICQGCPRCEASRALATDCQGAGTISLLGNFCPLRKW